MPQNSPPTGVREYTFNYSRSANKMRFILGEESWLLDVFSGSWEMLDALSNGNLEVACKLKIQEGIGYIWAPRDAEHEVISDGHRTHWRLCYNRADSEADGKPHWRLRDEVTDKVWSNDIENYRGVMNINYLQGGSHIFCDGNMEVEDGIAYFD